MKKIARLDEEKIKEIAKLYITDGETAASVAEYYHLNPKTVLKALDCIAIYDEEMFKKAERKRNTGRPKYTNKPKLSDEVFQELGHKVTRNKLIDWFNKNNFNDNIQVRDLIVMAEKNGIVVVR